jgi:ribosome maturation factor RimP
MKVKRTEEVIDFLQPIAEGVGVEIIDAEWNLREKALTVYIDAPGGIDLNLCEKFHRAIDEPLDELDPTFGVPYTLNCSSPGLDRPFKTARDFERHMNEKVEVKLYAPQRGKKLFEGVMTAYDGNTVTVATKEGEMKFPLTQVAKINLAIEFD